MHKALASMKQEQNMEEEIIWNDNDEDCKETNHTIVESKFSLNRENNIIEDAEDWSDKPVRVVYRLKW